MKATKSKRRTTGHHLQSVWLDGYEQVSGESTGETWTTVFRSERTRIRISSHRDDNGFLSYFVSSYERVTGVTEWNEERTEWIGRGYETFDSLSEAMKFAIYRLKELGQ